MQILKYLKNYDCANLEKYVVDGQMLGLVRLYGAVIANREVCEVMLTNHGAQQQLENIVSAYRYKTKDHFKIFISDKDFYSYFQNGVLNITITLFKPATESPKEGSLPSLISCLEPPH